MIQQPIMQAGPNIIEMAKKKRHLQLLSKLQGSGTLNPNELKELASLEGKDENSQYILNTQQEVAKFYKRRCRTIERWVVEGMPKTADGRYDIRAIDLWRESIEKQKKLPFNKKINWEDELKKFQAQIKELEYKKLIGELIPKEDVEKERVARIIAVKRKLLSFPRTMALQLVGLDPREIEVQLNERIREIIDAFAGGKKVKKKVQPKRKVVKQKPTKSKKNRKNADKNKIG